MNEHAISIRGLRKSFPGFQLGPLNMTVPAGSIFGFIGPNGSGKTTTLDLLMAMSEKEGGEIKVLGGDPFRDEVAVKKRVGYVSPDVNFFGWPTVESLVRFTSGFYSDWDDELCDRLLKSLHVGRTEKIMALSFGARIKLGVVLALAHRPDLLILDEPTVGLDAISKQQIFTELLAAVKGGRRTVLISSHGLADIERFADHIGMIKEGRLLFEGATDEVVSRYRMVDLVGGHADGLEGVDGLFVQRQERDRCRVLMDTSGDLMERLRRRGASPIAVSPVTLEDLFVALGKE